MPIGVAQETCDPATGGMTGSGTTFTSSSITVAAGSILVAAVVGVTGTNVTQLSDSVNGTTGWSVAKVVNNAPLVVAMGWRYFSTGQTVTVTATYTGTTDHRGIKLLEVTGAVTPGALDGTPAGQFQNNPATTADAVTSGNFTTTGQPALVIGACMNFGNNHNPAAGTGFTSTRVDWNTDVGGCRFEYKRVTATGTQAATYTAPAVESWITLALAFDEASSTLTAQPTAQEAVKGAPTPRPPPDIANPLPATKGSPWVFVEPPRIVPPRRQEAACANPLPPLAAVAAVSFAPSGQLERRPTPARAVVNQDPLPAARISPWFQENAPPAPRPSPRPRPETTAIPLPPFAGIGPPVDVAPPPARAPQRQRAETAAPIPSFVRLGAPVDPPLVPRFIKRLINLVYQVVGLPAVFIPVNTQIVRPPLVAKVDDAELAVVTTQLGNVVAAGSTDLTLAGDT